MAVLDAPNIRRPLSGPANSKLEKLEVFTSIASTNTYLMSQPAPQEGCYRVAIADHQTSGRGRHHRRWISAPGAGLCLSLSYTFLSRAEQIAGLTLAIGVGVIGALRHLEIEAVSLKWPNDIIALDGKLGGILTEVQSGKPERVTVVTGIGLNVDIPQRVDFGAESDWAHRAVDIKSIKQDPPDRELLAATLIEHLYLTLKRFEEFGLEEFLADWQQHDWLLGKQITVDMSDQQITGIAAGVDKDGALIIDADGARTRVISGSIVMAGSVAAGR